MLKKHLPPSWKRFKAICKSRHSLLRFMEYETLQNTTLSGDVLDVGGVKNSKKSYQHLFSGYNSWSILNISSAHQPDILADINEPLPFANESFDNVVCMNTLEHVENISLALSEMIRILRPNGKIIISMPFLFPVHGDPDDFHRPTASWWQTALITNNISDEAQSITPLVWCKFSTGMSFIDNSLTVFWRRLFRPFILLPGLIQRYFKLKRHNHQSAALGYIIVGHKI